MYLNFLGTKIICIQWTYKINIWFNNILTTNGLGYYKILYTDGLLFYKRKENDFILIFNNYMVRKRHFTAIFYELLLQIILMMTHDDVSLTYTLPVLL